MIVYEVIVQDKEYYRTQFSQLYKNKKTAEDCKLALEDGTIIFQEEIMVEDYDSWFSIFIKERQVF